MLGPIGPRPRLAGMVQRLFCPDSARADILARAHDRPGAGLLTRLRACASTTPQPGDGISAGFIAAAYAIVGWLDDDTAAATVAGEMVIDVLNDRWLHVSNHAQDGNPLWTSSYKMIMRTDPAVGVAIALSYAGDRWPQKLRESVAEALLDKAEAFQAGGGEGWNGSPVSNWHANTHSAAALCVLAAQSVTRDQRGDAILERAMAGVQAFLATGGERGWHQESWHYYRYALGHHLLPMALAWQAHRDATAFDDSPLPWTPLLYPFVRVGNEAVVPHRQRPLEPTHFHSGELLMGVGLVPASARPALTWEVIDRCGPHGDGTWDVQYAHHALLGLLHLPADPVTPALLLGRHWIDDIKGLYCWRQDFGNAGLLAVDANRAAKTGTGRPTCGGAFTFAAAGHTWAVGAEANHPGREHYSVPCHDTMEVHAGAQTINHHAGPDGSGSITLDLASILPECAPVTRQLAVSWSASGGAHLNLCDSAAQPFIWRWHGRGAAEICPDGWQVTMPDGAHMRAIVTCEGDLTVTHHAHGYTVQAVTATMNLAAQVIAPNS